VEVDREDIVSAGDAVAGNLVGWCGSCVIGLVDGVGVMWPGRRYIRMMGSRDTDHMIDVLIRRRARTCFDQRANTPLFTRS
jgi:hypothetical protein